MVRDGQTISRTQYKSMLESVPYTNSRFEEPDKENNRFKVKIKQDYIEVMPPMTPRFIPCVDKNEVNFFVEGIEPLFNIK
jgi:hypothetical protein